MGFIYSYSYDGRNEREMPRHVPLKNELGLRLHFRVPVPSSTRPPALFIRDLQLSDAGDYRCRIDYRNCAYLRLQRYIPHQHHCHSSQCHPYGNWVHYILYYALGIRISFICLHLYTYIHPYTWEFRGSSRVLNMYFACLCILFRILEA